MAGVSASRGSLVDYTKEYIKDLNETCNRIYVADMQKIIREILNTLEKTGECTLQLIEDTYDKIEHYSKNRDPHHSSSYRCANAILRSIKNAIPKPPKPIPKQSIDMRERALEIEQKMLIDSEISDQFFIALEKIAMLARENNLRHSGLYIFYIPSSNPHLAWTVTFLENLQKHLHAVGLTHIHSRHDVTWDMEWEEYSKKTSTYQNVLFIGTEAVLEKKDLATKLQYKGLDFRRDSETSDSKNSIIPILISGTEATSFRLKDLSYSYENWKTKTYFYHLKRLIYQLYNATPRLFEKIWVEFLASLSEETRSILETGLTPDEITSILFEEEMVKKIKDESNDIMYRTLLGLELKEEPFFDHRICRSIGELKKFSKNKAVSEIMGSLSLLRIQSIESKEIENKKLASAEEARRKLIKIINEVKENINSDHSSLHNAAFTSLLALAARFPLNKQCPISLCEVEEKDKIVTLRGNLFNLSDLITFHNTRAYKGSELKEAHNDKFLLNPLYNIPFPFLDVINITFEAEKRLGIEIPDLKITRRELINLAISGPIVARDIFNSSVLRKKLLTGDKLEIRTGLMQIALSHPDSARFILDKPDISQYLLVGYKIDIKRFVNDDFDPETPDASVLPRHLESATVKMINHILKSIAISHPNSAKHILNDRMLVNQLMKGNRNHIRITLVEIAESHPKAAIEILNRMINEGETDIEIITHISNTYPTSLAITLLCEKYLRTLKITETICPRLKLSLFTQRDDRMNQLIREYEGGSFRLVNRSST